MKENAPERIFVHAGIVGGLTSLIWIARARGERIELVDVRSRPVQKVDGLVPERNLDASGPEVASSGMNVATKESRSMQRLRLYHRLPWRRYWAARCAQASPPLPPPMAMRSKLDVGTISSEVHFD